MGGITKLGALAMSAGATFILFHKNRKYFIYLVWIGIMFIYYLFFFRIQSHIYYFLIALPSLAVLAAVGIWAGYEVLKIYFNRKIARVVIFIFLLAFLYKGGKNAQGFFVVHTDIAEKIEVLNQELVIPGPVVLIFPKWDWNSVYTYYTHRKGIVLDIKNLDQLSQYRAQGYKYSVFIDFKPEEINQHLLDQYKLQETHRGANVIISEM